MRAARIHQPVGQHQQRKQPGSELAQSALAQRLAVAAVFDPQDGRTVELPVIFGAPPSLGLVKAAGSVAGWMGVLAAYRGHKFPVLDNRLPPRHGVVLATNANRPAFLKDLPVVELPTPLGFPSRGAGGQAAVDFG